jgi:RING finger/CHY zinc finger protein 1
LLKGRRNGHEPCPCRWQVSFGAYGCLRCAFFEDETASRKQFHCEQCGLCRIGGRASFFHCDTCGCCYTVSLKVCSGSDRTFSFAACLWQFLAQTLHVNSRQRTSAVALVLQDNHRCVENSMRGNCPICFEFLFGALAVDGFRNDLK